MTTAAKSYTTNDIQAANRAAGFHWFDPDTMRIWGTHVLPEVYQGAGGVYFISSDKEYDGSRAYNVRRFNPETGAVDTADDNGERTRGYTKAGAVKVAKRLAGVTKPTAAEALKPVTVLEQFTQDLRTHGSSVAPMQYARELIQLAGRHHRQMEAECNHGGQFDAEGEPRPWLRKCRERIRELAGLCGCTGVVFSGDPRGCTVKLTFPDGYANDFGREGYCVPTSEKEGR